MTLPTAQQWILAALILCAAWVVSMITLMILNKSRVLVGRTQTTIDDAVLKSIGRPVHVGFQMIGIVVAARYLFPDLAYQGYSYVDLIPILIIAWLAYVLSRLIREVMNAQDGDMSFGFLNTLVSIIVWGLALTFILDQLGVDISALLAGLGIAGVAVALALQNTLSGLFSAVGLALDKPVRQGDFVQLENGVKGFVKDISMRATRIETFEGNLVIVPNSKLSEMTITNSFLPEDRTRFDVLVGVAYDTDLDKAERVAIEVAKKVLDMHGAGANKEPFVRFVSFGDSAIEMKVFLTVNQFLDQYVVKHDFVKALHVRFAKEKIEIPFPQRVVHMKK